MRLLDIIKEKKLTHLEHSLLTAAKTTYIIEKKQSAMQYDSKIGGIPDISEDKIPNMPFIAQINLKESRVRYFPDEGMLYFFYDERKNKGKVIYETEFSNKYVKKRCSGQKITIFQTLSFPAPENIEFYDINFENEKDEERYYDLLDELEEKYTVGKILGYSNSIEDDILDELKERDEQWVLLLQIEIHGGRLLVCVEEKNLKKKKFTKCRFFYQNI